MARKRKAEPVWFVYMLECGTGLLYTGISPDVAARYVKHCSGRGAAFTRAHPPRRIVAAMPCAGRSLALKTEASLKKLKRTAKLEWAEQWAWHADTAG